MDRSEIQITLNAALRTLQVGESFRVNGLLLGMTDDETMFVTGITVWHYLDSITKSSALEELAAVQAEFKGIIALSDELQAFVKGKTIQYNLAYDSGKSGVGICTEKNGCIEWLLDGIKE